MWKLILNPSKYVPSAVKCARPEIHWESTQKRCIGITIAPTDIIKKCFKLMYSIIRIKLPLRNMDNIWVPFLTNTFSAGPAKSNPSPQERDNMFLVHIATVMDGAAKKWQCCLCGKVSKLKGDILDHVECKHMNTAFLYSCRYCTMVVGTNRKLRLHEVESCTSLLLTLSE